MWIIFEGADGAGKSTLTEAVAGRLRETLLPVTTSHLGPPAKPGTALAECLAAPYADYTVGQGHLVSDRWSWGCPVYGPIYRPDDNVDGYGDFGIGGFRYAELFAVSRGAYIVLVDGVPAELRRRLEERGDDYVDLDDLETIVLAYRNLVVESKAVGTVVPPGLEMTQVEDTAGEIILEASARERAADLLSSWPHYVGSSSPKHVFHANVQEAVDILSNMDDGWRDVGFVDAAKTSTRQRARLIEALGKPTVTTSKVLHVTF